MYNWQPITDEEVKWWGVDFDWTICKNTGHPLYIPTEPLEGAVEALKLIDSLGYKITVFTARHWADYQNIESWCNHFGIPVRRIICGKPLLRTMYDDKNFGTKIDWQSVIEHYTSVDKQVVIPEVEG